MEVKLEKADWVEGLKATIVLLKNAMAQVEVYKLQVNQAELKIKDFPKKQKI